MQQLKRDFIDRVHPITTHGFTVGFDFFGGVPAEIVTTFPDTWLQQYQANNYVLHDPVVIWGNTNLGIKSWEELLQIYPNETPDVISNARGYGMQNGSVISVELDLVRTIVGLTHSDENLSTEEIETIYSAIFGFVRGADFEPRIELSQKSIQYLRFSAEGLTDGAIAREQNVTVRAVNGLRQRTLAKMSAETVAHAVVKARKARIID